jgi:hypothetical protein
MSNYNSDADKAEKQLAFLSPTMCYAKWAQVSIHLTNGMTHSCYHPPLHKINVDDIKKNPSALHNTAEKKEDRRLMLEGKRPDGCSYCWRTEDAGGRSDRIYRSGEYWAQNARKDIIGALDTGDIDPHYFEVNFNQACNFKCSYCSPHLSTAWEEEIKQHGPFKVKDKDGNIVDHNNTAYLNMPLKVKQDDNPYLTAFWEWWPQLYKKLEVFRITGGEPLMDSNFFKVLDYIYEHPNTWLEVSVTSNFCPPKQELMDRFITKLKKLEEIQIWNDPERFNPGSGNHWYVNMAVKNFAVFVSLDSVDKHAEYIRDGLDFSVLKKNVDTLLAETNNTTLTFINTFNVLSVFKFKDYLKYILELRQAYSREAQGIKYIPINDPYTKHPDHAMRPRQRIWFDIPLLRNPEWQSLQMLPPEFDHYLEDAIEFMILNNDVSNFAGFYDFEIEKAERNLVFLKQRSDNAINKENFIEFFKQHDLRRGTNFLETFPEFKDYR